MKTLAAICAFALTAFVVASSFAPADNVLTLDEAIAQQKVQATVLPFGDNGYSEGLRVNVKNTSGKTLKLVMPKGTIFVPDNGEEQTLITNGDEVFALNAGQEKQVIRPGFCTELHDHGSDEESTFKLSVSKNEKLLKILSFMDSLKVKDDDVIQHAVWCITDNASVARVDGEDTAASRKIRERICAITGQTMPWYTTDSQIERTPELEYVVLSTQVEGELSFKSKDPVDMQGVVKDSTGKIVWTNPNKITGPKGNITFWYRVSVSGWAAGKYYVVYTDRGKEIINQEFEL